MPKRTIVSPKQPARHTRITADKGTNVSLVFDLTFRDGYTSIKSFNHVHGLVHRANGSYGIINQHGVRFDEVFAGYVLLMVNGSTEELSDWSA